MKLVRGVYKIISERDSEGDVIHYCQMTDDEVIRVRNDELIVCRDRKTDE